MKAALASALALALALPGAQAARVSVEAEAIRAALEEAFETRAIDGVTYEIQELPRLFGSGEEAAVEVLLPEEFHRPGLRAVTVQCRADGRVTARGLATVLVRARRAVWIATRSLKRGELLDPGSLRREDREFEREPLRRFVLERGERWRLKLDVDEGLPLRASDVERLPDVETGDEVRLVSRAGQAEVSVVGRVRRGGNVGERILVLNPVTGRVVRATLSDRETARLEGRAGTAAGQKEGRKPS